MSKPKFEIKDREVFRDGEKIGFFNDPDNHYQATRGNAEHREEFLKWFDEFGVQDTEQVENIPPAVEPTDDPTPEIEVHTADPVIPDHTDPPTEHVTARPVELSGDIPVPEKEPPIRPGMGIYEPSYVWWAWHQDDARFTSIYGKNKATFKKENGGYLDKVREYLGKGATL